MLIGSLCMKADETPRLAAEQERPLMDMKVVMLIGYG